MAIPAKTHAPTSNPAPVAANGVVDADPMKTLPASPVTACHAQM